MTTYRHGHFVWRELMSTDVGASLRFYSEVFGWKGDTIKMPDGMDYTLMTIGDDRVAGLMKTPEAGLPAFWGGSVSVDDVDAAAGRAAAAGGKVIMPPMDAAGMGRYAGIMDPQNAYFSLWKGADGDAPVSERPGVGTFCWEQLNTSAPADALNFYQKVFGWTNEPFGGGGDMKVFKTAGTSVASVMQNPPGVPPHWLSYVVVDKLASAYDRVRKQGGQVMVERIDVPTVGTIGVIQDNVGAVLGVFEMPGA